MGWLSTASAWDSGTFNVTQAQALASQGISVPADVRSGSELIIVSGKDDVTQESRAATSGTVSAPSSGASATSTETSNSSDDGSSTNVGAIAGGVAGGVAALAAVGLAAFFLMRRKKKVEPQWDYKEQDITVSPFFPSDPPGSQPLMGTYPELGESTNMVRIQPTSNTRVDLASPIDERNTSTGYYTGSSGGNAFSSTSSSSGVGPHPMQMVEEPLPPPYSDHGVVLAPSKGR